MKFLFNKPFVLFGLLACVFTAPVHAISPYVLPLNFDARANAALTVDAGFTQKIFIPATPLGETQFTITRPNGTQEAIATVHHLKTRTVLEYINCLQMSRPRVALGASAAASAWVSSSAHGS